MLISHSHRCYYCVAPTEYAEELYRKCIRHLRSRTTKTGDNDDDHIDYDLDHDREVGRREGNDQEADAKVKVEDGMDVDPPAKQENGTAAPAEHAPAKRKAHDRNFVADEHAEKRWSDNVDTKAKLLILPRDKLDLSLYGAKQKEE